MTDWKPGTIPIRCVNGGALLPGWISEPFGLDWGIHKDTGEVMWVLHHMPTGWDICAISHPIGEVMRFVDLLRSLGDWSFRDPSTVSRDFADAVAIARAEGFDICAAGRVARPDYPDRLGAAA
ncbi:MAG: hypothetical protein QM690_16075 [Sphingobium sp.]